jgi:hypothetical protein
LTAAQQRLWYLCQDPRQNAAYHIAFVLELEGELDPGRACAAFHAVVRRHEGLRTVFRMEQGQALQFVREDAGEVITRATVPDPAAAGPLLDAVCGHVFDLAGEVPVRACLVECGPGQYRLAVNLHHIACDAWSVGLLLDDFVSCYGALGGAPEPAPLPLQLVDAAAWLAAPEQRAHTAADLRYWQQQLLGHGGLLPIVTDFARPAQAGLEGDAVPLAWPASLSEAVERAARQLRLTPFMVLFGAFALLLRRLSGSDDLVIGVAYGQRPRLEFESLVGFFANTLPLRVRIDGSATVGAYLDHVRQVVEGGFAHALAPVEQIIDTLALARPRDRMPLFQAMMTLQTVGAGTLALPGVAMRRRAAVRKTAKFDLSLVLADSPAGIRGEIEYDLALFRRDSVENQAACLRTLVEQLAGDGACRLADLAGSSAATAPAFAAPSLADIEAQLALLEEKAYD